MTKFPTESRDVQGLSQEEWPTEIGKVGGYCGVPGCAKPADHAHHLFSRGMMGGAYDWVRLPSGAVTGNLMPLCFDHHEKVTNNQVGIMYDVDHGFRWVDPKLGRAQEMSFQPPYISADGLTRHNIKIEVNGDRQELTHEHEHEREICPTCARPMPKPKLDVDRDPEAPKERKTWAVAVPADKYETGADVLDELLEGIKEKFEVAGISYGDGKKVKYFILSTALALFLNSAEQVLSDG